MENIGLFLVLLGSLLLPSEGPVLLLWMAKGIQIFESIKVVTLRRLQQLRRPFFFKPNGSRPTHKAKLAPSVRDSKWPPCQTHLSLLTYGL